MATFTWAWVSAQRRPIRRSSCSSSGTWFGAYAPAGTPRAIVDKLNNEITAVLKAPAMVEKLEALGVEVTPGGPDELARLTRDDFTKWSPVVVKAGIKPE